jgi:hypothetical protein
VDRNAYYTFFEVFQSRKGTGSVDIASIGECGLSGNAIFGELRATDLALTEFVVAQAANLLYARLLV